MAVKVNRNRFGSNSTPLTYGGMGLPGYSFFGAQGPGFLRGSPAGQQPQAAAQAAPRAQDNSAIMMQIIAQMQQNMMQQQSQFTQAVQELRGQTDKREQTGNRIPEGYVEGSDRDGNPILINLAELNRDYQEGDHPYKGLYKDPRGIPHGTPDETRGGVAPIVEGKAGASSVNDPGKMASDKGAPDKQGPGPNSPVIQISEAEAREIISRPDMAALANRLIELQKRGGLQVATGVTAVRPDFVNEIVRQIGGSGIGAPGGSPVRPDRPRTPEPGPRGRQDIVGTPPPIVEHEFTPPPPPPPFIEETPEVPQQFIPEPIVEPSITEFTPYEPDPITTQTPTGDELVSGGYSGATLNEIKSPGGVGYLRPEMYGLEVTRDPFYGIRDKMTSMGPTTYTAPDTQSGAQFDEGSVLAQQGIAFPPKKDPNISQFNDPSFAF